MALTFKLFTGQWCPSCSPRTEFISRLCIERDFNLDLLMLEEPQSRKEAERYQVKTIPMVLVFADAQDQPIMWFGPTDPDKAILKWLEERNSSNVQPNVPDDGSSGA